MLYETESSGHLHGRANIDKEGEILTKSSVFCRLVKFLILVFKQAKQF